VLPPTPPALLVQEPQTQPSHNSIQIKFVQLGTLNVLEEVIVTKFKTFSIKGVIIIDSIFHTFQEGTTDEVVIDNT